MEESTFEEVGQHFCSVLCLNRVVFMWGKWAVTKSAFNADHDLTQISQNLLRLGNWRCFTLECFFCLCQPFVPSSNSIINYDSDDSMDSGDDVDGDADSDDDEMETVRPNTLWVSWSAWTQPRPLFFSFFFSFFPILPRRSFSSLSVWASAGFFLYRPRRKDIDNQGCLLWPYLSSSCFFPLAACWFANAAQTLC